MTAPQFLRAVRWVLIAAIFIVTARVRFAHPELTETQLFLAYWSTWVAVALVGFGVAVLMRANQ